MVEGGGVSQHQGSELQNISCHDLSGTDITGEIYQISADFEQMWDGRPLRHLGTHCRGQQEARMAVELSGEEERNGGWIRQWTASGAFGPDAW
ncbi:MAG: hypothetical protein ACLUOI_01720 [Eisenbergiella sp.]